MTDHRITEDGLTRRQVLHSALAGGAALSGAGLLAACGSSSSGGGSSNSSSAPAQSGSAPTGSAKLKTGGSLSVGATGGGAKDTIDGQLPTADTDIMRTWNLYEPLAVRPPDFGPLEMMVAESLEAEHGKADSWIVKVRPGIEFHNGKTVTADDVIFSLQRILDPKSPKVGAASIGYIDTKGIKKLSSSSLRIPLKFANATFPDDIGQYFNAIVPVGFDPAKPVGTGAFMFESFTPGQQSVFKKFPNYWQTGKPYLDSLTIIDFTDDTARVNALLGGQVGAIDNLPTGQIAQVQGNSALKVLISETGEWQPFTMRVDQAPFSDPRVR
ncbi:MAG: ABC transporter substrate-binding protein, partial [Solirubrobacteraceae bacterium]